MANEATQIEGPYESHDFTVAEDAGIPQYTLCKLSDPRTAAASSGADVFAGIAATEKVANNGVVDLGLFTEGTFLLTDAGAGITTGAAVALSGANLIKAAVAADLLNGKAFGKALQTIAGGGTGEVKIGSLS